MLSFFAATLDLLGEAQKQGLTTATDVNDKAPFGDFVSKIIQGIMVIALLSVLIFLVWGSFEWIISGGDKTKIEAARNKMTGAVVGLIVLASSVAIYFFIQKILGVEVFTQ